VKLDRVLVPLDGSPLAERALRTALALLRERPSATVILMRAAQAATPGPWTDPIEAEIKVVDEAKAYLGAVAGRLRDQDPRRPVTTSVWYGPAARAVADAADASGAQLIMMSTHGRSGLRRMVLGSVAESVLRTTATPVLLVPADARHLPVASAPPRVAHAETIRV
jgi:nucleotide-binding universal stress UspA family protein